ncbi:MAG: hypothetical protein ABI906_00400 [Pseudomonadota bacterium]
MNHDLLTQRGVSTRMAGCDRAPMRLDEMPPVRSRRGVAMGVRAAEMSAMKRPMRRVAGPTKMNRVMVARARAVAMMAAGVMMAIGVVVKAVMVNAVVVRVMLVTNAGGGVRHRQRHGDDAKGDGDRCLDGFGHVNSTIRGLVRGSAAGE